MSKLIPATHKWTSLCYNTSLFEQTFSLFQNKKNLIPAILQYLHAQYNMSAQLFVVVAVPRHDVICS